jgi:hypothetical protein
MGDIEKVYTPWVHASPLVDVRQMSQPEGSGESADNGRHAKFLKTSFRYEGK